MRKFGGVIMLLFGSVMIISFLIIVVMMVLSPEHFNTEQYASSPYLAIGYFLMIGIMGFAFFMQGLRFVRKPDTSVTALPPDFSSTIVFSVHLSFSDFLRANFAILSGTNRIYLYPAYLFILLFYLFSSPGALGFSSYGIWILLGLLSTPAWMYYGVRKNYDSSKAIQQEMTYTISKDTIHVQSDTLDSKNSWNNVLKVVETKGFFFIYTQKIVANIIPKSSIGDEKNMSMLRAIIRSYPFEKKLLD